LSQVLVKQLIEAGVHFGHRASRWNPKMRPYIYGRRNLIHIIDVRETIRGLLRAKKYLTQVAQGGSLILFVGTKRQAGEAIEREAKRCHMPYVNDRWLGGTLTNFRTIRSRLVRLEELEKLRAGEELATYSKKMQSALAREYRKMGVPTVALIDTDCDPDEVDLPIPGNDDSLRSIELVVAQLADAVVEGSAALRESGGPPAAAKAAEPPAHDKDAEE
jgi:small subunit ribosomal protein S2